MEGIIKHFLGPYLAKGKDIEKKAEAAIGKLVSGIDLPNLLKLIAPAIKDEAIVKEALADLKAILPALENLANLEK